MRARAFPLASVAVLAVVLLSGCGDKESRDTDDPDQVDAVEAPELGACRVLTPKQVDEPSNATRMVDCQDGHTAETFAVGELPDRLHAVGYEADELGAFAYKTCSAKFEKFLGADESAVMRSILSWAWFRPSEKAWDKGARWYRCDVIGGGDQSTTYVELPATATGILTDGPDEWMVCADGTSVQTGTKVACTERHTWRAVTTIKVGDPKDPYPGDELVEITSRDYCSESVAGWLGYPPEYDFGYTWFHEGEWKAGNRRSVCWAATTK